MQKIKTKKILSSFVLGILLASQVLFVTTVLLIPKPVQAQSIDPLSVPTADQPSIWQRILIAAGRQILLRFVEHFINKFVNKLLDKYKIRNFLYYDQVLSDYYLNRFIRDKIKDPNLYSIYTKLESAYVSGQPTGATNAPDPRKALIPQIKKRIYDLYVQEGGVPTSTITSPPSNLTDADYFALASLYFLHPPESTENNVRNSFNNFQVEARDASQDEIKVGSGLKAARDITGAVNKAKSFISNPTVYTQIWLDSVIKVKAKYSFDPNDFWSQIGSLVGNYIWSQLTLDRSTDVLPDDPNAYLPEGNTGNPSLGTAIDIDGDGIMDGYDYDGDGQLDVCNYGGLDGGGNPPCMGSIQALNGGAQPDLNCTNTPGSLACNSTDHSDLVTRVKNYLISRGQQFNTFCDAYEITRRVAWALRGEGVGLMTTYHTTQCNGYSADVIAYTDNSGVDILTSCGPPDNTNGPTWQPLPPGTEQSRVHYEAPTDPGDPAGSY
jgi:hypothetical protein